VPTASRRSRTACEWPARPTPSATFPSATRRAPVAVLDNQGRTDATVWGDILTEYAASRHLAGTAIWGVGRDTATALRLGYPMYSHGRFMRTGKDRVEVADTQVPVALADVQVRPGDIVVGDDDGVVAVPRHRLAQVADLASEIAAREDSILAAILDGATIADARKQHGYHTLQRKEK
jgi:regulator of RNase E activity RraA